MKTRKGLWATALAALFLATTLGSCKDENVELAGAVCPMVISTSPTSGQTNVPLTQVITITFNEPMNPVTITQANITLEGMAIVPAPALDSVSKTKSLYALSGASLINGTVTCVGSVVTFKPSSPLLAHTTYTCRILSDVKDNFGNALPVDYVWSFSTGTVVLPTIVSVDPLNNATSVVITKVLAATFSVPMDATTITGTTFTLKQGVVAIAGAVTYTGNIASFNPTADLVPNTVYTATISTGAKNVAGTALGANYVWSFTTASLLAAPTVSSVNPLNNATLVPITALPSATFSEVMDPLTITATTFTLMNGITPVAGAISYTAQTATFTPTAPLLVNTLYTATITNGAKNVAGTALAANKVWSFTTAPVLVAPTVSSVNPLNNAILVPISAQPSATFSQVMDPLTLTATTFTLMNGVTPVAGSISYLGQTATFTPTAPLLENTLYTASVTTGAKNVAGTALAANEVWTFTTAPPAVPPTIVSVNPLDNAVGVSVNLSASAIFSEAMDPLTITTATFKVMNGVTPVAGVISYIGTTATFNPTNSLLKGVTYTATITNGVKTPAGTAMVADYIWSFTTETTLINTILVDLKSVDQFGIIAGVGVSNEAGFSEIHDLNVGIYPGVRSSITGFPPAIIVNGQMFASDDIAPPGVPAMLLQAKDDLTAAYLFAEGASSPAPATVAGDQGGRTLAPGIYKSTSTLLVQSGNLTLDAQGDVNAVWIFQIASDFTTVGGAGGSIILSGGAQAKNIFWQVGRSATIGDFTVFKGNVLALTSITMNSGAVAQGRMLARNGSVVLTSTNIITKP